MDKDRESSNKQKQNRINMNVLQISLNQYFNMIQEFSLIKGESQYQILTGLERRSWGWRRVISS